MRIKIKYEVKNTGYIGSFKDRQGYNIIFSEHNSIETLKKSIEEYLGADKKYELVEKEKYE